MILRDNNHRFGACELLEDDINDAAIKSKFPEYEFQVDDDYVPRKLRALREERNLTKTEILVAQEIDEVLVPNWLAWAVTLAAVFTLAMMIVWMINHHGLFIGLAAIGLVIVTYCLFLGERYVRE